MSIKKIAAVTGSARGIGNATAKALAEEGYLVILSDIREPEQAVDLINEFTACGYEADYMKCNIADSQSRTAFFHEIHRKYGRLDVLVNNAGVAPKERLDVLETTAESFDFVLGTNLKGTFFMCQEAAKLLLQLKQSSPEDYKPRIVNISSCSAYTSSVNRGEYCISKAGISMVTKLFADRLAEEGIPVFEVRPGIILTDMTAKIKEKYQAMIDMGLTPIKRFGTPQDVANCVIAAASGRLDFSAGQVLNADGGFELRRL